MSADVVWCGCGDGIPVEELKCATCRTEPSVTAEAAVILTAFTGTMLTTDFAAFQSYAERVMERQVYTHEFASELFWRSLKERCEADARRVLGAR